MIQPFCNLRQAWLLFLGLSLVLVCCKPANLAAGKKETGKWTSLFNGKNLQRWTPKISGYKAGENFGNTFRVADGLLQVRYDQYDSFKNTFGALYFDQKFTNYRLKVEYRFIGDTVTGAPSWGYRDGGIQYHCQAPATLALNQSFPVCLEYNLHGGNGTGERPVGEICANGIIIEIDSKPNTAYCTPPAVKRTFHGDQWVTAEIEVRNGAIQHFVNGEQILAFQNPRYDAANELGKALIVAGDATVRDGYISIQSNSQPMDFRKIEIQELD